MKGKSLIEVLLVFTLFEVFFIFYKSTKILKAEIDLLGWSYLAGSLMILIPVLVLVITKRDTKVYGLTLSNWRETLDIGMTFALVIGIISIGIGIGVFWLLNIDLPEILDSLVSVILGIIVLFLILAILRRHENREFSTIPSNIVWLTILLLIPILVGLFLKRLTLVVGSTILWQFLISGFGEEILFRGYIQSRINEEFGRPFTLMGVNFGAGVIISSVLFGLAHVLNPFNPFMGEYELAWWWGLSSGVTGFTFGMVREKTGSIIASSIGHGLPDALGESFALMFSFS